MWEHARRLQPQSALILDTTFGIALHTIARLTSLLLTLAAFASAVSLTACGGGGGGGGGSSASAPGPGTGAALLVTGSSVPPNALGFAPDGYINVFFNVDLGTSVATPSLIQLTEGSTVVSVATTAAAQTLTIRPTSRLKLKTRYTLTIKSGFPGTNSVLANDYVLEFTTDVAAFDVRQIVPADPSLNTGFTPVIAAGDFNSDGKQDVLELGALQNLPAGAPLNTAGYTLRLYTQNSGGTFTKSQQIDVNLGPSNFSIYTKRVVVLDTDGDGIPEILVPEFKSTDATDGGLRVFRRNAVSGQYEQVGLIASAYLQAVTVADVDGDGRPDLVGVASGNYSGGIQVLLNQGAKSASAPFGLLVMPVVDTAPGITDLAVRDLNHDGNRQLVVRQGPGLSSSGVSRIDAYAQSARGVFLRDVMLSQLFDGLCASIVVCSGVTVIDIDGDGLPDLVLEGNGTTTGYIRRGSTFTQGFVSSSFRGYLYVTDVDRDGLEDLMVVSNQGQPFIAAIAGNRSGNFLYSTARTVPLFNDITNPGAATIADFNGDGLPDIVIDEVNSGIYLVTQR